MKKFRQRGSDYLHLDETPTSNLLKDIFYDDNGFNTKTVPKEKFEDNKIASRLFSAANKKEKK